MFSHRKHPHRFLLIATLVSTAIALVFVGRSMLPAAEKEPSLLGQFMRKKLDASGQVLEGLATKDAELIRNGASSLLQMSKAELWNVIADAEYREFNGEFRSSLRKLEEAASQGNFDNALLQWFDTMKGCVECHKYVRESRVKLNNK